MQKILWKDNDIPESTNFGDVYYNIENGLEEKKYIFVQGNELDTRFKLQNQDFHILELGFGTGLSFLLTLIEFIKSENKNSLYFTSTEMFPLNYDDISKALKAWGDEFYNNSLVQEFLAQYQVLDLTKDINIKIKNVNLTILIGDANQTLSKINEKQDCFYLDGFSPAKNPELWSEQIFAKLKDIAKQGSTTSTYSASRLVKDRLDYAGFTYSKKKGFGKKRDMLIAKKD